MNNEYKVVWSCSSTNNRHALAIVSSEDVNFPAEGGLAFSGVVAGVKTYVFTPGKTGEWVMALEESVSVHYGAAVVEFMYLQSSRYATILTMGGRAVVEVHGYKDRGSTMALYLKGVESKVPPCVLLAMGLIDVSSQEVEKVVVPSPPKLDPGLEAAFAASGM